MRGSSSRLLIFGAALFGLMAIVAFLPFGPFGGSGDPDPTPTPPITRPSILDDATPPADDDAQAPQGGASGPPPDSEQVVCIDPGHGGWDHGWERTDEQDPPYAPPSVIEAELNMGMAFMLRDALEAEDITVVMTREGGGAVNMFEEDVNDDGETRRSFEDEDRAVQAGLRDELQARIDICNDANADLLISLHLNGFNDRALRGYEILYTAAPSRPFGDLSEELGRYIYGQLDTAMRESDYGGGLGRGVKDDTELDAVRHEYGTADHLLMTGPAIDTATYSIRPSEMPGVIIEGVFLSNDQDATFIIQPDNQRLVVDAYARGILEYFEEHPG